jgi:uncharacterized FAD-dependent dehydrogenase
LPLRPVVVGFGPCGIFAALVLAQMGFKPIVLERGKPVRERTKDTWGLWRKRAEPREQCAVWRRRCWHLLGRQAVQPDQGPAPPGPQGDAEFVKAGAPEEILYEAHPHIGTFKLVKVVENLREQIIALGGESASSSA